MRAEQLLLLLSASTQSLCYTSKFEHEDMVLRWLKSSRVLSVTCPPHTHMSLDKLFDFSKARLWIYER